MPIDYRDYAANYRERSRQCKDDAGNCCEWCGVAAGEIRANWRGEPYEVVLTAAHLDHDPENPAARLACLCQVCHLEYDRPEHIASATQTWRRKFQQVELEMGQIVLFDDALVEARREERPLMHLHEALHESHIAQYTTQDGTRYLVQEGVNFRVLRFAPGSAAPESLFALGLAPALRIAADRGWKIPGDSAEWRPVSRIYGE